MITRCLGIALLAATVGHAGAGTLEDVRAKGALDCIINTGLTGFAFQDNDGEWQGFDVSFCRAVAAGVLGDPKAVRFINATGKTRFTLLASGEGDMLSRNTTWTYTRDNDLGLTFVFVNYYDGQGFIVKRSLGVGSAGELDGAAVCIQTGTTTELNLDDYFRVNNMSYEPVPIETNEEAKVAYEAGRCDAYTTDASGLASTRAALETPGDHMILPEIISKEPLALAVREGDDTWADVVRWIGYALLNAEEYGVTAANARQMQQSSSNPEVRRLLGAEGNLGDMLGLDREFALHAIEAVGNYGEIYERYLTPLGLPRGLNALYREGGIQYAPPMR